MVVGPPPREKIQANQVGNDRQRNVATLQLVSDVADLALVTSGLGYVSLDDGLLGIAGMVSSILGVYAVWLKTA